MDNDFTFLEAIRAVPDDDGPRLDYAMWLTNRGNPLGSFIRNQIFLSQIPDDAFVRADFEEDERRLLTTHWQEWIPSPWNETLCGVRFRRGFVEQITIDPQHFLIDADQLFARFPLIRRVWFFTCWKHRQHEILDFQAEPKGYYSEILRMPQISRLETLSLHDNNAGDIAALALADSSAAANLKNVYLSSNGITDVGVEALVGSSYLRNLATLDLTNNPISESAGQSLLASFGNSVRIGERTTWH